MIYVYEIKNEDNSWWLHESICIQQWFFDYKFWIVHLEIFCESIHKYFKQQFTQNMKWLHKQICDCNFVERYCVYPITELFYTIFVVLALFKFAINVDAEFLLFWVLKNMWLNFHHCFSMHNNILIWDLTFQERSSFIYQIQSH